MNVSELAPIAGTIFDRDALRIMIAAKPGPMPAKEIARETGVSISTTYRILNKLLRYKIVSRVDGPTSSRRWPTSLWSTELGQVQISFAEGHYTIRIAIGAGVLSSGGEPEGIE